MFFKTGVHKNCAETPTGVFCEYCEILMNSFFIEHLWWLFLNLYYIKIILTICGIRDMKYIVLFSTNQMAYSSQSIRCQLFGVVAVMFIITS